MPKIKRKALLTGVFIAIVIIFFLIGLANFLSSRLFLPKLEKRLSSVFERPVEIKKLDVNFAFARAVIREVTVDNLSGFPSDYLFKADKVIVEGSFIPFWKKKLIILRRLVIIEPEINIDYLTKDKVNLLVFSPQKHKNDTPIDSADEKLVKAAHKGVYIKKLLIKKAKVNLYDYEKGKPHITVAKEVDIGVENFTHWLWAKGMETLFVIKGKLEGEPAADFEIQGKINYLLEKKISGTLQLIVKDIDLVHFAPYYASTLHFLDVESGLASIYASLKCDKNNLLGASKLVIKNYALKAKDKKGASIIRIGESLTGETGQLELMLRIGGTLEKPTYVLSTDISEAMMREFFNRLPGLDLSGVLLEGARKATGGLGKQVGDTFGNLFLGKKQ